MGAWGQLTQGPNVLNPRTNTTAQKMCLLSHLLRQSVRTYVRDCYSLLRRRFAVSESGRLSPDTGNGILGVPNVSTKI